MTPEEEREYRRGFEDGVRAMADKVIQWRRQVHEMSTLTGKVIL